jgi:hypothetical protein
MCEVVFDDVAVTPKWEGIDWVVSSLTSLFFHRGRGRV